MGCVQMAPPSMSVLLSVLAVSTVASAYPMYGSARRFVRPVRSSWPQQPAAYYPAYYPANPDYEDDQEGRYSEAVSYYPPPRYYYGRALDPVDDLQLAMRNEERGAELPIGQETWFERQTAEQEQAEQAERAAANDAFMQNLIEAEMYRNSDYVDEERQLKSLSHKRATVKPFSGQKEVAMLRPPNPARSHPPTPAPASKHAPSVYDTIKQMLDMDKVITTFHTNYLAV